MINASAKFKALSSNQYVGVKYPKFQIVLHHTAGTDNATGVVDYWNGNKERVATAYLVDRAGKLVQCFDDEYYAYSLYVSFKGNNVDLQYRRNDEALNRGNIGIEMTNPGGLTKVENGYKPWYNVKVPFKEEEVFHLNFRDFEHWLPYSGNQLATVQNLLITLLNKNPIIKEAFIKQDVTKIFDINIDALSGKPGVYTHVCYRTDKSDLFPHPDVITMLQATQSMLQDPLEKSAQAEALQSSL